MQMLPTKIPTETRVQYKPNIWNITGTNSMGVLWRSGQGTAHLREAAPTYTS